MNKYDFGYEIHEGSTMEWAYNNIGEESIVLEIGSANGNLTKHLKENKKCIVDIIEIDDESGVLAARFARNSFIGDEQGDIEKYFWYEQLERDSYDYIVILDVLEHLKNPEEALIKLKEVLKNDGLILLSIPNIAHNSIIINLINNKFDYTEVGLLDNTHLRFFTYFSLCSMLRATGLKAVKKQAIQIPVGLNEIACSYEETPPLIESCLRIREFADVYQFLFFIKKDDVDEAAADFLITNLDRTLYKTRIYINGKADNMFSFSVNPVNIDLIIKVDVIDEQVSFIRIDPIEKCCIVKNVKIYSINDEESHELLISSTNGIQLDESTVIFSDGNPQIFINITSDIDEIKFSCECHLIDDFSILDFFSKYNMEIINKIECLNKENHVISEENHVISEENHVISEENHAISEENYTIREQLQEVNILASHYKDELNKVYVSKWWKLGKLLRKILGKG